MLSRAAPRRRARRVAVPFLLETAAEAVGRLTHQGGAGALHVAIQWRRRARWLGRLPLRLRVARFVAAAPRRRDAVPNEYYLDCYGPLNGFCAQAPSA